MSLLFNAEWGFLEGIVRGFKNGMLKHSDYLALTQCDSIEDLMMSIQATDYGNIFANDRHFSVDLIEKRLGEKLLHEFNYIRAHSTEPLSSFLEYIRYPYMIDNVSLLISGLNNNRPMKRLLEMCNPLGYFDQLAAIEVAVSSVELFNAVLIDTPLAKFIPPEFHEDTFSEIDVEIVRGLLYRSYLESYYAFCQGLGGTTSDVMCKLLSFEADRRVITITVNALPTNLTPNDRLKMYPTCGQLPDLALRTLSEIVDYERVRDMCNFVGYGDMFENIERDTDGLIGLEDRFLMLEAKNNVYSYLQQFHYGVFYSYVKLKQLEVRNIIWICECIAQRQTDKVNAYIPIPLD
ncbi:probable V-type proton ATPase subunit d 2 [Drosophila guanche]|uniref:V-type proton ATPase subunit n=1 Tax=Drosophila guanche TaxID=7266 RepID=A0A3B0K3B3_DROGU|nr:probable V-type proton ATPase subunit d 2 [Drosophila guanche]SPP80116.1 blast:Probable V-type proton ATPase subunit d 2 [Drosophila guanche]